MAEAELKIKIPKEFEKEAKSWGGGGFATSVPGILEA